MFGLAVIAFTYTAVGFWGLWFPMLFLMEVCSSFSAVDREFMINLIATANFAKKQPRNWASLVTRIVAVARLTLVVLGVFGFASTFGTMFDALGTGDWQASLFFEISTASTNPYFR